MSPRAIVILALLVPSAANSQGCPAMGATTPTYQPLPGGVNPTTGAHTPSVANGGVASPPGSENLADIPPALAGRISTFRVLSDDPQDPGLVGYIRLHDDGKAILWIARTPGSEKRAADIRRFRERDLAAGWLMDKAVGDLPPKPRRQVAA